MPSSVGLGVADGRMTETSRGALDATGKDEAGWQADRRVGPLDAQRVRHQEARAVAEREHPQPVLALEGRARTLVVVLPRLSIDENERQLLGVVAAQWLRDRVE